VERLGEIRPHLPERKHAMNDTVYLGDAVYAHYDGYGIELRLNSHENSFAVYLEPEVMQALIEFWNSSRKESAQQ
jgi:hypothetical protein